MTNWHTIVPSGFVLDINGSSSACFSTDLLYRPVLERRIGEGERAILWIGMNPSTADAYKNDPTVKREIDFSTVWGFGRYVKANVCDFRSTDPKGMLSATNGPRSTENIEIIHALAKDADRIVVCHGVLPKPLRVLATEVTCSLIEAGFELWCLGLTKDGWPRHPLYMKADTLLQRFAQS